MTERIATRLTAWGHRLLDWADIHARPFHALVRAYLVMDLRNQQFARATATGPADAVAPLFWVVGQYLLVGAILSSLLFARVDAFFFALAGLSMSMAVMASAIIVEFHEVVLDPGDQGVIGHLPIPLRTYATARLTNLLVYVLLITAALNVFPAIVGVGLRDAGWRFLSAYMLAALLGNLAVSAMLIVLYTTLLSNRLGDAVKHLLAWTQIVLIMVLVYGGQAALRDANETLAMLAYNLPRWISALPSAWLATAVDDWSTGQPAASLWIFTVGTLTVVGLWLAAIRRLSALYAQMQPGRSPWHRASLPPLPQPGILAGPLTRWLTRSREETVAFWLCSTMLKRDHELRMRSWPALGVVIALLLLGLLTGQLMDPLAHPGLAGALSIACLYVLAVPMPTLMHNLNFSADYAASWVLWSAPVVDRCAFAEGMRKAVTYRLLVPLLIGLTAVFAVVWRDLGDALLHGLVGWLVIVGAGYATQMGIVRTFPFSVPLARGQSMGSIALFAGILNGTALGLAILHYLGLSSTQLFASYIMGLLVLVLILRHMARRVMSQHFARRTADA